MALEKNVSITTEMRAEMDRAEAEFESTFSHFLALKKRREEMDEDLRKQERAITKKIATTPGLTKIVEKLNREIREQEARDSTLNGVVEFGKEALSFGFIPFGSSPELEAMEKPAPEVVIARRKAIGLTQTEAGALVHAGLRKWQKWEGKAGTAAHDPMGRAEWELFLIKTEAILSARNK